MRRRALPAVALAAAVAVVGTAYSSSGDGGLASDAAATTAADPSTVSGDITVLDKTGPASAMAVVLLGFVLLVTWVQRILVPDERSDPA